MLLCAKHPSSVNTKRGHSHTRFPSFPALFEMKKEAETQAFQMLKFLSIILYWTSNSKSVLITEKNLGETLPPSYLLEDNLTDRGDHTCPLLGQGPGATTLGGVRRASCSHWPPADQLDLLPTSRGGEEKGWSIWPFSVL